MSLSLYVTNAAAFFPYVQTLYMIENKTFLIFTEKKHTHVHKKDDGEITSIKISGL
jgi:hypothetical protein